MIPFQGQKIGGADFISNSASQTFTDFAVEFITTAAAVKIFFCFFQPVFPAGRSAGLAAAIWFHKEREAEDSSGEDLRKGFLHFFCIFFDSLMNQRIGAQKGDLQDRDWREDFRE